MNKTPDIAPKLQCPTCKTTVYWRSDYPYRPFCSERCRLIDLGEWASEGHKIPGKPADWFDPDAEQQ
ncbi:DNA gyrase inhibitor YacG [Marinimicrobium alkaliphilum]|uniref:DNA gyrase inhibitor YacG n=1 Tax=Marinimicrobium alkaliphilum TaxID=2202654 RepID=UPI000DB99A32|nr:DNA gyrase inhibitor YacG [Marinimicrobium alkaliphilum]